MATPKRDPVCACLLLIFAASTANADPVDDVITAQMKQNDICGLSLAIIDHGDVLRAQGYGFTAKDHQNPVTRFTLFQAASMSKPVAAMGVLWLVEHNMLTLDDDVNQKLTSWKVPDNQFTAQKKVTLRELLSHTAGTNVHGFTGYARTWRMPTLLQILDGQRPANSLAIRVEAVPGTQWRYSGGGYTIMLQLVNDVTQKSFPRFMQETVLSKLNMTHSTYEQILPDELSELPAKGYYPNGSPIPGGWRIFPNLTAGGLWTTPSDLAKFAIEIQNSLAGRSNKVLSPSMTRQMLTVQMQDYGLGMFIAGKGNAMRFYHDGTHFGYQGIMLAFATTGQGAVIMINDDRASRGETMGKILQIIAREYDWKGYFKPRSTAAEALPAELPEDFINELAHDSNPPSP